MEIQEQNVQTKILVMEQEVVLTMDTTKQELVVEMFQTPRVPIQILVMGQEVVVKIMQHQELHAKQQEFVMGQVLAGLKCECMLCE